ncbi:citrate lyase acyl carrier protein [Sphaerochaeta sp. PS]|jgi:citrate lyase subunit gamma (acyl carrier protein)|uniref:citrate lyase acyl carrier protein n=1 Tax=Sphaerochaeta sp. PS TaxID=3076336 RepID=UPI0028A41955|nr:citrate lyase acyl carrier protein [Sphaerochaeta sp. PS]MDT4761261.1 citrate lyase acyl carrier protein [Sphaerochaeta sp. PS]
MDIVTTGFAGTMESSDIMVTVSKAPGAGITIQLTSSVSKQFGKQIRSVIRECAESLGVKDVNISAIDQGALDCVIKARVKTAIYRACLSTDYRWEV